MGRPHKWSCLQQSLWTDRNNTPPPSKWEDLGTGGPSPFGFYMLYRAKHGARQAPQTRLGSRLVTPRCGSNIFVLVPQCRSTLCSTGLPSKNGLSLPFALLQNAAAKTAQKDVVVLSNTIERASLVTGEFVSEMLCSTSAWAFAFRVCSRSQ